MGRYNPNFPTVLGNEFGPIATDPARIDTGTAFGYTFRTQEWEDVQTARVLMTAPPPGQPYRKVITAEVYPDQGVAATGPMRKILVPAVSGSSYLNAALVNAATYAAALQNPTDNARVSLTGPLAGVRIFFDTSTSNTKLHAALLNSRIVDVSVRYAMTGEFDDHAVPVTMSLERISAAVVFDMDASITGEELQYENVVPRSSRLGDYNPFWNTTINPNTDYRRAPWVALNGSNNYTGLEALAASGGTNVNLRFLTASTVTAGVAAFNLHYVALEITYCQESRVAAGGLDLSGGVSLLEDMFYADVPIFSPTSYGFFWDSGQGDDYAITIGQGYVGATSVTYPVPVTVDRVVPARDTFRGHRGVLINKTLREGEHWTREDVDAVPGVALYDSASDFGNTHIYPPSQVYVSPLVANIDQVGLGSMYQGIDQEEAGNTYLYVRFYARKFPETTDYLELTMTDDLNVPLGPSARIYPEEFDALPELSDGWKEVTLTLSEPWVTTGSSVRRWNLSAATATAYPWQVLGAEANPYRETTGGSYSYVTYASVTGVARVDGVSDNNADFTLMFIQELEAPGNLTVTPAVQALTVLDDACGFPPQAIPTGIRYHQLEWTAVNDLAVAGFAHYEVQRRDTTMAADEWETVGLITNVSAVDMDDYEARVGVVSSYRVRQVHEDGYTSAWSDTATSTIVAPGVTGTDINSSLLILTSNINPDGNLAYVYTYPGSGGVPSVDFSYPEAGQVAYQQMYGRDYQVAFRPLERSGTEFTRTLLVNAAGVPTLTADKTLTALRDLAWDTVPYVCTRDERANRWLTSVEVPSSAAREVPTAGHLVLAPVTFVEVTATPAPVDVSGPCEGLRLEGADTYQYWDTEAPAALGGTRDLTDTFTRVTANAWGNADTGQAWTTSGGVAADFDTNGTQGRIISSTVTVNRMVVSAETYNYHRSRVDFTVPAVATGAAYYVGLVTRWQDASNYYMYRIEFATAGTFKLDVVRVVAGVATVVDTGAAISTYTVGTVIHVEEMTRGTTLNARVWKDATTMPIWDDAGAAAVSSVSTQTTLATTGRVGVLQQRATANTNVNLTVTYADFTLDELPVQYDVRALVRAYDDQFGVQMGSDDFTNDTDTEGLWGFALNYGGATFLTLGAVGYTEATTEDLVGLGLVKNRETWVRAVVTQDDGTGAMVVQWYTLADDGVTWTLVDTTTVATPTQPVPPLLDDGGLLNILNSTGGIWTKRFEVRVDGVLVASPDFAAEAVGTESFTDDQGNLWSTTSGRGLCAFLE